MKTLLRPLFIASIVLPGVFAAQSCSKEKGCMDKTATNYNPSAVVECVNCCIYAQPTATTNGNMLFYSTADVMPTVTLSNGMIITASANTGCTDSHYNNHIALPKGNYTYTATNTANMNWSGSFSVTAGECSSMGLTNANAAVAEKGTVQFSTNNTGLGSIKVTMNSNTIGTVDPYIYSPSFPGPGFDVSVIPGTYSYTAQSTNGQKWVGTTTIVSGKITPILFTRANMSQLTSGYSNIIFYSSTEADYSIRLNNVEIGSGVNYTGTDLCSQNWEVSSVVPFGTYTWSATTLSGKYFSGTVVANLNGCVTVQIM